MAPEQARSSSEVTVQTDVYALGAILYELLCDVPPFHGGPREEILDQVRYKEPSFPTKNRVRSASDLETIALKCLQKSPDKRYKRAADLAEDLGNFLDGRPIHARPVTGTERFSRWIRRQPAKAALIVVCVISGLSLIAGWLWQVERERGYEHSATLAAQRHAEEMSREGEATRQNLYAVELSRVYDAWYQSQHERARQILDQQRPGPGKTDLRGFEWDYLWKLCNRDLVLRGHQGRIMSLAFSPDGRILASASNDHTIKLWKPSDGSELSTLGGHTRAVVDLAFSPDGRELYSGSYDGSVRRWDVHAMRGKGILTQCAGAVLTIAASPDGKTLAFYTTVGKDANCSLLNFLNLATGEVDAREIGRNLTMWCLGYSPDGALLAHGDSQGRQVWIWDTIRRRVKSILKGHELDVNEVSFSRDGRLLASESSDRTIRIWELSSGRELTRQSNLPGVFTIAFSPDGETLAFTHYGDIRFWDHASGNVRTLHTPHIGNILATAFSSDQKILATGGADGSIRLWNPRTELPLARPSTSEDDPVSAKPAIPDLIRIEPADCLALSADVSQDGQSLAAGTNDGSIHVWDLRSGAIRIRMRLSATHIQCLKFFPDGQTLAVPDNGSSVHLYDATNWRKRSILSDPDPITRPCWALALLPDGRTLIAGKGVQGAPGTIVVWDASTGSLQNVLRGHSDYVRAVTVLGNRILASGSGDETIKLWDVTSGAELATLSGHKGQVFSVAADPLGRLLASASEDQTVRIWDVATRREMATLREHVDAVYSVAFTHDRKRLVSGGRDGSIILWDIETCRKVAALKGHSNRINKLAFFPDDSTLVSAGADRTIRLWRGNPSQRE